MNYTTGVNLGLLNFAGNLPRLAPTAQVFFSSVRSQSRLMEERLRLF